MILCNSLFLFVSIIYGGTFEKIQMHPGETRTIQIGGGESLQVSRRGHLDMQYQGDGKWQLTAMRSGLVMISPGDTNSDDFRILIEILADEKNKANQSKSKETKARQSQLILLVNVELLSQKDLSSIGINPKLGKPIDLRDIEALRSVQSQKIITQPYADIYPHKELQMQSGGEFKTQYDTQKVSEVLQGWKSFGLELTALIADVDGSKVRLEYNIIMSSATNGFNQLIRHQLKSSSVLHLNQKHLVGILDTTVESRDQQRMAFVENIPIIGPLLRLTNTQNSHDQIFVWLTIKKRDNLN